mgnify:FL=1
MGRNLSTLNIKDTYEGLVQISGSILTDGTGSVIPSIEASASFATSASYAENSNTAISSSYALSSSYSETSTSASHAVNSDTSISSSYSLTASFAENVIPTDTGSFVVNAVAVDATTTYTKGDGSVFTTVIDNVDTAVSASYALTASYAENVTTSDLQTVTDAGATTTNNMIIDGGVADGDRKFTVERNSGVSAHIQSTTTEAIFGTSGSLNTYQIRIKGGDQGAYPNSRIHLDSLNGTVVSQSLEVVSALTASGLIYPTADGTTGQVIETDGSGNLSFVTAGGGGAASGLISGSAPNSLKSDFYTTTNAKAEGSGSISIGDNSRVTGSTSENTIVIGKDSDSKLNSIRNVIVGYNARMQEDNRNDSVIIGANAAGYQEGVAIGADAFTIYQAVAIGKGAYTNDNYAVAVGAGAKVNNTAGIAIGSGSLADGNNAIAIGQAAHATAEGDVVFYNGVKNVYEYDKSIDTTLIDGQLNIDATTSVYAISASLGSGESFKVDYHSNGARVLSGRTNSVLHLGTPSITNSITIGRNNAIGFFGDGFEPGTNYNFGSSSGNIKVPFTFEDLTISGSVVGEVDVISDSAGTTTMDCSASNFFTLAMPAGGTTVLTPSNIQAGQTISVKITQNATPSTLTFAASVEFEGGTAFTISTGASAVDVMTFISFDGTTLQATGLTNFS